MCVDHLRNEQTTSPNSSQHEQTPLHLKNEGRKDFGSIVDFTQEKHDNKEMGGDHNGRAIAVNSGWQLDRNDKIRCNDSACSEKLKATVNAYEDKISNLDRVFSDERRALKKAYTDCQRLRATKSSNQDTQIRTLQASLLDTETKLQKSQETIPALQQRCQGLIEKSACRASELQVTKVQLEKSEGTAKENCDRLRVLVEEKTKLTADLAKQTEEHTQERERLKAEIERQRIELASRSTFGNMTWEDSRDEQDTFTMRSNLSADVSMMDAPSNLVNINVPPVSQIGQENLKLRQDIQHLTQTIERTKIAATSACEQASNKAAQHRFLFETAKKELTGVKSQLEDVREDYNSAMVIIQMDDPSSLYHPLYKKMADLRQRIKLVKKKNTHLKEQLLEARALSWDRRTSMVEDCVPLT